MIYNNHSDFLEKEIPKYADLTKVSISIIERLLNINKIEYLSVSGRVKDKKSALEKIERKKYKSPEKQMTDLSGLRIIVFFESDIEKIVRLIRKSFVVDEKNSLDQTSKLGNDKIGYRSVHFVCSLGESRAHAPEYEELVNLKFELQIRTVLQHAWAELAHDRSYKFNSALPSDINRKINLYAGLLEIADLGFNEIINDIKVYSEKINNENDTTLLQEEINSITLTKFFIDFCANNDLIYDKDTLEIFKKNPENLVDEVKLFGIKSINDLKTLFTSEFMSAFRKKEENIIYDKSKITAHIQGFIRDALMYHDLKKYLIQCVPCWNILPPNDLILFEDKYGIDYAEKLLTEHHIEIQDIGW